MIEHRRGGAVIARVVGQTEQTVRVHRIVTDRLELIGADLVGKPKPATFLLQIEDDAATVLREAGLPCPVVSVGSTPTAHNAADLSGVTEVRAGVFVFFDLVMAGIGVCDIGDIALSVLATVIGHQHDKGWIIVDAGWMAMSRDRGTT